MNKISMIVAGVAGYVLGTRAGREQYDTMAATARKIWRDPKVQRKAGQAQQAAGDLGQKAGDKVTSKVKEHTGGDSSTDSRSSSTSGTTPDLGMPPTDGGTTHGGTTHGGGPHG